MEKGNNLRIFCSITAFENIRKIITETVASDYILEMTENKDISGKVIIETIETKERNIRRTPPIFVINIYRATHQHSTKKWTPSTEISVRDITSTKIIDKSERKGNRHM